MSDCFFMCLCVYIHFSSVFCVIIILTINFQILLRCVDLQTFYSYAHMHIQHTQPQHTHTLDYSSNCPLLLY